VKNALETEELPLSRGQPASRPNAGALAECRRLVADRVGQALAAAVGGLDAGLQCRRAAAGADQDEVLVEAQFHLRSLGADLNRRFHEVYESEFQLRVAAPARERRRYGGIALPRPAEAEEADDTLARRLAAELGAACTSELDELRSHIAPLLADEGLREDRDPIAPAALGAALGEIVWQLDCPRPARALLLELLHGSLAAPLPAIYREAAALLSARA